MVSQRDCGIYRRGLAPRLVTLFLVTLGAGLFLGGALWAPGESTAPGTTTVKPTLPRPSVANTKLPVEPMAAQATAPTHQELSQQIVALKQRLALLENDSTTTANLNQAVSSNEPQRQTVRLPTRTDSSAARQKQHTKSGQRSLAYWHGLNRIMLQEEQMRKLPAGGLTADSAARFLQARGEAGKYAAKAIRLLPASGVDREVVALATDIAAWYEQGTSLNDMGSFLLNKADADVRRGAPGEKWGQAEQAHSQSVGELNRRGDHMRKRLIRKYRLDFPDLR